MATYPGFSVFQRVTADNLNSIGPNVITKVSANSITSNTTQTNDPELSGVTLGIGTWEIDGLFVVAGLTAALFKCGWAFSGTLGNTPTRTNIGPGPGSAAAANSIAAVNLGISNWNTVVTYGLGNTATNYVTIQEMCEEFQVTTSGTFSVQVSQNTSNATPTIVRAGSRLRIRQIA